MPPKTRTRAPLGEIKNKANATPVKPAAKGGKKDAGSKGVPELTLVSDKPISRKRKSDSTDDATEPKKSKGIKKLVESKTIPDISDIHLDGEESHSVPVYDTCDMVRSKLKAFEKKYPKETTASLARRIEANTIGLRRFRDRKGYDNGSTSDAFYQAYIFLEKIRLAEGKEKSKDRLKMEELWSKKGGFDIARKSNHKGLFMSAGEHLSRASKYGEYKITRQSGRSTTGIM